MVLEKLCSDVFYHIFSYMKHYDIYHVSMINKSFFNLISKRFKNYYIPNIRKIKLGYELYFHKDDEIVILIPQNIDKYNDEMILIMYKSNVISIIMYKDYIDKLYTFYIKILMTYLNKKYFRKYKRFKYKQHYTGRKSTNKLQFKDDYKYIENLDDTRPMFDINYMLYYYANSLSSDIYVHPFHRIIDKIMAIKYLYKTYIGTKLYNCDYFVDVKKCDCDAYNPYYQKYESTHSRRKKVMKCKYRYYFIDTENIEISDDDVNIGIIKTHPPNIFNMRYNVVSGCFINSSDKLKDKQKDYLHSKWLYTKKIFNR